MSKYGNFADTIPDLGNQMGITSLDLLDVAIGQSEYYGHKDIAAWFSYWKERFTRAIKEEWDVDDTETPTTTDEG